MGVRRYDWERWLKSPRKTLTRGRDFNCTPLSMAQQVRNAASALRISVKVRVSGDRVTIRTESPSVNGTGAKTSDAPLLRA